MTRQYSLRIGLILMGLAGPSAIPARADNGSADSTEFVLALTTGCADSGDFVLIEPAGPDCNNNGLPDQCDIADGTSRDCNGNAVPDECDIAEGTSQDCNHNGVPDLCDINSGTSQDANGNGYPDECDIAGVVGRIFYNQSWYDGNRTGIDPAPVAGANNDDDDAIDPDKEPLLSHNPPMMGYYFNYTSYDKGINGLIFDVVNGLRAPVVGDFTFTSIGRTGTGYTPPVTVTPSGFLARPLPGGDPTKDYRVVLTFANGSLIDTWLECTVGTGFGLSQAHTCWWGNAVAETLTPSAANLLVNNTDIGEIVSNQKTAPPRIPLDDWRAPCDINKDGLVNNTDIGLCTGHQRTSPAVCVKLIAR